EYGSIRCHLLMDIIQSLTTIGMKVFKRRRTYHYIEFFFTLPSIDISLVKVDISLAKFFTQPVDPKVGQLDAGIGRKRNLALQRGLQQTPVAGPDFEN